MGIITHTGLDQLLVEARKENPWLPHGALTQNIRLSDVSIKDGKATGIMSGRYGSGYDGFVNVTYHTIDIGKLFAGKPLVVGIVEPKPIHELLEDIYSYTGIKFGTGDIENIEPEHELPYTTKIKAKSTSAVYIGETAITFQKREQRLDEVITRGDYSVDFRAFDQSSPDRARGEHFTYGTDYTTIVNALSGITVGTLDAIAATALATNLNAVDDRPWTPSDTTDLWSLLGANVIYNGPVLAYNGVQPNLDYTHVIVVDMVVDRGPGSLFGSKLYIHYNVLE